MQAVYLSAWADGVSIWMRWLKLTTINQTTGSQFYRMFQGCMPRPGIVTALVKDIYRLSWFGTPVLCIKLMWGKDDNGTWPSVRAAGRQAYLRSSVVVVGSRAGEVVQPGRS